MRLFIAISVPEELKIKIAEIQEKIKQANSGAKLVESENLHFTLKFLGEANNDRISGIKTAIERACVDFKEFEFDIAGMNAFPNKDYAHAIWLSVKKGSQKFQRLYESIDKELSREGFEKEKVHIPHLTIARILSERNKPELLKVLGDYEQLRIGNMHVKEVKLVKSILSIIGPIYEEIYSVKLK